MRRRLRLRLLAAASMAAACGVFPSMLAASPALAAGRGAGLERLGTRPALPSGARSIGALAPSVEMKLTITLQPRDPAALRAYASAVSTPGSGVFHNYLSVSEFAQRFGASASEVAEAKSTLRAAGLVPGAVASDHLSFSVSASAAHVALALHTSFERYRLSSGQTAFENTSAPELQRAGAAVIQSVLGLSDVPLARPEGLARPRVPGLSAGVGVLAQSKRGPAAAGSAATPRAAASSAAVSPCSAAASVYDSSLSEGYLSYTANQIAQAYDYDAVYGAGDLGSGVTVGLFELEPFNSSDIQQYDSCYDTSTTPNVVSVDGGASCGSGASADPECGLEDDLDIEDVISLAPKAAVNVYEGPNTGQGAYDTLQRMIAGDPVKVISTSWGECEPDLGASAASAESTLFEEAASQGQSVLAAAGDQGAVDCQDNSGNPTGELAVDDPASQPDVTGVGGTSLTAIGNPPTESVWNDGYFDTGGIDEFQGAGGGGVSSFWGRPSYQDGVARTQSQISCGSSGYSCREVPDVSADADEDTGYVIYWTPPSSDTAGSASGVGWSSIGGTSAAAPTWAALIALADASAGCAASPVGFADPSLYEAAKADLPAYFNDITSGDNDAMSSAGSMVGYSAGSGYDMASGLGSPKGAALVSDLCHAAVVHPVVKLTVDSGYVTRVGDAVRIVSHASDSAGSSLHFTASTLPTGLAIDASTGVVSGRVSSAVDRIITITATDAYGASSKQSLRLIVEGTPSASATKLTIVKKRYGTIALSFRAGRYAPLLKSVKLTVRSGGHFNRSAPKLRGAVTLTTLTGARIASSLQLVSGSLLITFDSPRSAVRVRLGKPALIMSSRLSGKRSSSGARRRLGLTEVVTEASGFSSRLSLNA